MKKAKFWLYQIIMVAIVSVVLGSPALADKPIEKQTADCVSSGGWFIDGQCSVSSTNSNGKTTTTSNNGKGKGSGSDSGTTDSGYTTGDQIGTTDGDCPDGYIWLDLYNRCIPFS